ncbi:metal-dependent hydrolase [Bdellovibrionota bacterium FG-1]
MDNVTHSLIGVLLAEGILRARKGDRRHARPSHEANGPHPGHVNHRRSDSGSVRAGVLWAAVFASNLPDFDFLMRPWFGEASQLGYLLHHRGYTHTFLLSIPLAVLAAGVGRLAARRFRPHRPGNELPSPSLLLGTAWLALLLHLCADSWNDYGVHPFWPVVSRWFYGDFIFILEPLIWLAALPFVYRISRSRGGRFASLFLGVGIVVAAWLSRLAPWPVALWITLWGLGVTLLQKRRRRLTVPVLGILAVLMGFAWQSQQIKTMLRAELPPGEKLLDVVASPAPSNPFCWRVILVSHLGQAYRARLGVVASGPFRGAAHPTACFARLLGDRQAPLKTVSAPSLLGGGVSWLGEFRGNISEIRALAQARCRVRGLLHFVRVPFWIAGQGPHGSVIVGDLRYDNGPGARSFATLVSEEGESCPSFEPSWEAPGLRLLSIEEGL